MLPVVAWSGSSGRPAHLSEDELNAIQGDTDRPADPALTPAGFFEPAPAPETAPNITLEFEAAEADLPRLLRAPALRPLRSGPGTSVLVSRSGTAIQVQMIWHDTADGALAEDGLALCQTTGKAEAWRLERLHPGTAPDWLPAHAAPLLEAAATPDALHARCPDHLAPAAAFAGRLRVLTLQLDGGPGSISLLTGTLRGVATDQPACRVMLTGPLHAITLLATALADQFALAVPRASLAAQALALARGRPIPARRLGAPAVPPGLSTTDALACIAAHLADVILHWAAQLPAAATPEPVHQMRVGVRRLRSALSAFRRAAQDAAGDCAWLDALADDLRDLAGRLGAARDWDVFLHETGADVSAAFPGEPRIARLLAAAARRQAAAYAGLRGYLASQDWTRLALRLALLPTLRPWDAAGDQALLAAPAETYAARALDRRLKHVLEPGPDLSGLPAPHLHDIRKQAKRLRYATEFFAPLFPDKPVRKYLPRLEQLQAALGAVNDTDVAAGLMAQLAGGADRAFAAGVVQGFGAAQAGRAAAKVQRAWERFYRAQPFWD